MVYAKLLVIVLLCGAAFHSRAQQQLKPAPTAADVAYGPHERNVLDFWKTKAPSPTPLVVFIHGGGFRAGSKSQINAGVLRQLLEGGISVAAINYRFVPAHPLPAAHEDSRRAIQFLRTKAAEWGLDKKKFGAFGGSAGAQLCMYLAFHDDMAKPASEDPIERESTRLAFIAPTAGQTSMDFQWWKQHIPGYNQPHRTAEELVGSITEEQRERLVKEISALSLISADDPPVHMSYAMAPGDPPPPDPAKAQGWRVHHVNFGIELKKKMDALGVEADLKYPGAQSKYNSVPDFFLTKFGLN
jgi:pimeloyl-ACP methyl ester carboxylesterase